MAPDAYQAIVYDKGSVVFRMLARGLGEEPFAAMLGELAKAVGNRVIDTETFFLAMERMSGFDLQPFMSRFVRGTGIPEVYYRYSVDEAEEEGKWVVRGEAHQVSRGQDRHTIERTADENWQVRTEHTQKLDVESLTMVVPFQLILTPPEEVERGKKSGLQSARGFGGRLVIEGSSTEFEFVGMQPKQALQQRASRLANGGDLDGAEIVLREALTTPLYSERGLAWLFATKVPDEEDLVERRSREDSWIHAMLARIQIEQGRYDDARKELLESEGLVEDAQKGWGWNEQTSNRRSGD
jgi:hypothetical protein